MVSGPEDELNNIASSGSDFVGLKGEAILADGDVPGYGGGLRNKSRQAEDAAEFHIDRLDEIKVYAAAFWWCRSSDLPADFIGLVQHPTSLFTSGCRLK